MIDKLNEVKAELANVSNYTTADRLFTRVAMLVRESHLREDSKKCYCDKIASFELSKMAAQEILMPNHPLAMMAFKKFKEDADNLLNVIIEEETIVSQKTE